MPRPTETHIMIGLGFIMKTFLLLIELISGILLIASILLHSPKGDGLGSIGGSARLYNNGPKNLEEGLNRFTAIIAVIFLTTATALGFFF